jgi:hypothetical protein
MVLRPNDWEDPRYCNRLVAFFNNERIDKIPCMHDMCPLNAWLKPSRIRDKDGIYIRTKGKCNLDGDNK